MKKIILISEGPLVYLPGIGFIKGPGEFYLKDEFVDMNTKLLNVYGYFGKYRVIDIRGSESITENVLSNIKGINVVLNEEYKEEDISNEDKIDDELPENLDNVDDSSNTFDVTENTEEKNLHTDNLEELKKAINEVFGDDVVIGDVTDLYPLNTSSSEVKQENVENNEENIVQEKNLRKKKKKSDIKEV